MEQAKPINKPTKSANAFRTISEAARELDLPQHVLRFWESKFPQIKPLKRAGGRRYYRPEDIELLSTIKDLLHTEGYTIKGVQKMLRQNNGHFPDKTGALDVKSGETPQPTIQTEVLASLSTDNRDDILSVINELEAVRDTLQAVRKAS